VGYFRKEEDAIDVGTDNFDVARVRTDLPDQGTQDALQAAQRRKPTHNVLLSHEERWMKHAPDDASHVPAISHLTWRISVQRDTPQIVDQRKPRQTAYALTGFRDKVMTQDGGDHDDHRRTFEGEACCKAPLVAPVVPVADRNMHTLREIQLWEESGEPRRRLAI